MNEYQPKVATFIDGSFVVVSFFEEEISLKCFNRDGALLEDHEGILKEDEKIGIFQLRKELQKKMKIFFI